MAEPGPAVIDTHIHLFPASELDTLRWCTPGNPLRAQRSVDDYLAAVAVSTHPVAATSSSVPRAPSASAPAVAAAPPRLRGYVFVETDRTSALEGPDGWKLPFLEIDFLRRVADSEPRTTDALRAEGHRPEDSDLLLAIVPWAPIPAGPEVLDEYIAQALAHAGGAKGRVRGWRYLVQEQPDGTMTAEGFVGSLRRLGERREVFDLGIDCSRRGDTQMREAVSMLGRVYEGVEEGNEVDVVINHMCKPNMSVDPGQNPDAEATFASWSGHMKELSKFPNTYMKLSGGFSEIDHLPAPPFDIATSKFRSDCDAAEYAMKLDTAKESIYRHLDVVLKEFGPERCMFGSDWPVCNIGGGGQGPAWASWYSLMESWMESRRLSVEEKALVWAGTAEKIYLGAN